ncbi:MAG: DUF1571 domain-containing protein [Gemmataceae bacterium]|nr:DUF1571 domain-containing protein [Gemmataceae bacterium]
MSVARSACVAALLAGTLAGCSGLRWFRGWKSASADVRITATSATLPATTTPPDYAPALYIPGPAPARSVSRSAAAKSDASTSDLAKSDAFKSKASKSGASPSDGSKSDDVLTLPLAPPPVADTTIVLPPLTPSEPAASDNPLRALHARAALKWSQLDAYGCRIRRREAIAGQPRPEEIIAAKFRKEPFSVFFEWLGPEAKGREVVYVQGQHGNLIHTLTAPGDIFLMPGGTRFKIAPDNLLVKNKSRYPITEAGVGALIDRFGELAQALERGDPRAGSAKYLGQLKRKEFETKVEVVVHAIAPGWEPLLPSGGQRLWCFDPEHGLPVLIVTHDNLEREVEYYCHDRFEFPGRYRDDEFDPDKLWSKSRTR